MNPLEEAVQICGSQAELARRIDEKPQTVSAWLKRAARSGILRVPAGHCPSIEEATEGRVVCERLNPDVKWSVVRGRPLPVQQSANADQVQQRA